MPKTFVESLEFCFGFERSQNFVGLCSRWPHIWKRMAAQCNHDDKHDCRDKEDVKYSVRCNNHCPLVCLYLCLPCHLNRLYGIRKMSDSLVRPWCDHVAGLAWRMSRTKAIHLGGRHKIFWTNLLQNILSIICNIGERKSNSKILLIVMQHNSQTACRHICYFFTIIMGCMCIMKDYNEEIHRFWLRELPDELYV